MGDIDNPFNDPMALAHSNYCVPRGAVLAQRAASIRPSRLTRFVHDALRAVVLSDYYTCDGAKAAIRSGQYGFGFYEAFASDAAVSGLARDLFTFTRDASSQDRFATYIASFAGPHPHDESDFERLLWDTLQRLSNLDRCHHQWSSRCSPDPASPDFAFSFAGVPFFIVGLHAASSRAARRFAWPTLVFNPHRQFDELRRSGRYARFQQVIRSAELQLQGSINPMLSDHGTTSEASQYSGRQVDTNWECPFHAQSDD